MNDNRLVWIDVETTGLDPDSNVLLEIAVAVTDAELNILDHPYTAVIAPDGRGAAALIMDGVVREMHSSSGLLDELPDGIPAAEAEAEALTHIRRHVPVAGSCPLAGSSVGFDRSFLTRYMPDLAGHLHYRNVDVSSVKELARRWYPDATAAQPRTKSAHRALPDILASIAELDYWRRTVFAGGGSLSLVR